MKKLEQFGLMALSILLLIGIVSAGTPLTVGGGWVSYSIPQSATLPIPSTDNPFTYTSAVPTHVMITDGYCVGDQPAVFDLAGNMLGAGQPVTSTKPYDPPTSCTPSAGDGDTAYAGVWSHACIDMPASPTGAAISFDIKNIASYSPLNADGGWVKVEAGLCPGPTPAPEFPTMFLPVTMIIGFFGAVLLIQRTREN